MCRNTILRFVLLYFYLYTQEHCIQVLANVSGFKKIPLAFIFLGEMLRKNVMLYEIFYCIKVL